MSSWILSWIATKLLKRKFNLNLKLEIQATNKEIIKSRKLWSMRTIISNNFDINPGILRLFYFSFWFDAVFLALSIVANLIYTPIFFYNFMGCQFFGINVYWDWIGTLIINLLVVFFLIRMISDYYKLSLRGSIS